MAEVRDELPAKRPEILSALGHKMKGTALSLSLITLGEYAKQLESVKIRWNGKCRITVFPHVGGI
jgi:HPt (histidine-containing phosphotransfer) domain-containing protein